MNLTSCDNCGVVLDKNKLHFDDDIYGEDGCIDMSKADYSHKHKDYVAYVPCPVCKEHVWGRE